MRILVTLLLVTANLLNAGNPNDPKKFVSGKDVFGTRNFIENKGQFDKDLNGDYKIEAILNDGGQKIYFTNKGLVYELIKNLPMTEEQREAREKGKHPNIKPPKINHVNMNWLNANPNISIEKSEKQAHYFTYGEAKYNSYAYKKLTYKNVYPNIDIEYTIPEDKDDGIKYNVIVHPGGNVADIKIAYTGDVEKIKQTKEGDVLIKTPLNDLIEHAPKSFYENKQAVESSFVLSDGVIGFGLPNGYDQNKTLIIDPWVTLLTSLNITCAYDVDYDYAGNAYVFGGITNFFAPCAVAKYNAVGILQWVFSGSLVSPFWTGGATCASNFVINKATGQCYVGQVVGGQVIRLDLAGNYDNLITPANSLMDEIFDLGFNCINNEVFVLGGGPASNNSGMKIDPSTGATTLTTFQPTNFMPAHDVASHAIDNAGNIFIIYASFFPVLNNAICAVNSTYNGNVWTQPSTFLSLVELANKMYYPMAPLSNAFNCLAVNDNYLFYYDGSNLAAYSKLTGALTALTTVPTLTLMYQGGIAVDDCNNLYLGGNGSLLCYNFTGTAFNPLPNIPLGSLSSSPFVYDIKLDKLNNMLYVCGNGFLGTYSAINSPFNSPTFSYSLSPACVTTASFTPPNLSCASASTTAFFWSFGDMGSGSSNTSTLSNPTHVYLNSGTYTAQLILNYACGVDTLTQTIIVPQAFNVNTTFFNCSYTATITSSCSSESYSYTWLPSGQTGSVATNLSAGTYSIIVGDLITNTAYTLTTQIIQPNALSASFTASSPTACAGTNVTLTANASGGSPGYTYNWTGGPSAQTHTINESLGGLYTYTVTTSDGNNCSVTNTIAITFYPFPTVVVIPSPSVCPLQTASLTAFGATNYTWLPGGSIGSTFNVNPASTSIYTVIGSTNGCVGPAVTTTVNVNPIPTITISSNSPVCSTQTLNLFASGGSTYQWTGPNAYNTNIQNPSIGNVSINNSGNYIVIVTALNSCTAIASTSVNILAPPSITISSAPTCTGQTLNLFANAGAGATYTWSGPSTFTSTLQNPVIATANLAQSGSYTVTVTSAQGCTNSAVVNALVVPPPFPVATLSGNGTLCAQALNGSPNTITLTSSGANTYTLITPAYIANNSPSGSVNNLSTTPPFQNNLTIATATLTGSNGVCTNSITVNFTIVPNPTVTVSSPTPVICAGQSFTYTSNGAASYTWGAGTPGLTTYTSPITVASPTVTSVYSLVGGSLGCNSGTQTNTLTVNPLPILIPSSGSVCIGSAITLSVGGTATNFTWSPNIALSNTTGAITNASPTNYQVYNILGELNSCTNTAQTWVYVLPLPEPSLSVSDTLICLNETTALQGFGGGSNGSYEWKSPDGRNYQNQNINLLAYNMGFSGTYTLIVTDDKGCKNYTTTSIYIKPLPSGNLIGNGQGCVPFCTQLSFSSGSPSTTATWQYNQQPIEPSIKNCFNTVGNHILSAKLYDAITGCSNTITKNINVYEKPQADFNYNPSNPIEGTDEVEFINTSTGDNLTNYSWYFNSNIPSHKNTGFQADTKNTNYLFDNAGTYVIAMIVKNGWGCADTSTKSIRVEPDFNLYIPNTFTPNEDDKNETFQTQGTGIRTFKLLVFNRWGEQVFESKDITKGWDGTYKGQPCKSDVYVWKLHVTDINGKPKELYGHVTLYR